MRNARYRHPAPTLAPRGSPAPDDGITTNRLTPIFSILTDAVKVVSGDDFTMAVLTDGTLWAVGRNDYGQLGLGTVIEWATTTVYNGRTTTVTEPANRVTASTVDGFGNLMTVSEIGGSGGPYNTSYVHNAVGELTSMTDHLGNPTTINYDRLGRKTSLVDPDAGTWQYGYDAAGNMTSQRDGRNQWLYFTFDALNRMTERRANTAAGPLLAQWTYDPIGGLGLMNKSTAFTTEGQVVVEALAYDNRYRATSQRWTVPGSGGGTFNMAWTHDPADRVRTVTYPGGNTGALGETITFGYDNRVIAGQSLSSSLSGNPVYVASAIYNPLGQLTSATHGTSGTAGSRTFTYASSTNRLSSQTGVTGGVTRLNRSYAYDNAGNVTRVTDVLDSNQRTCYRYDNLWRLTETFTASSDGCTAYTAVGTAPFDHDYAYSVIGNLTSVTGTGGGTPGSYTYGSSRPHAATQVGSSTFAYDGNGNQTSRTVGGVTSTLTWDAANQLSSVTGGGSTTTMLYDAEGGRVKRTTAGQSTVFVGADFEWSSTGATTHYRFAGEEVALRTPAGLSWMFTDRQGSTSVVVDPAAVVKSQRYYPFGQVRQTSGVGTDIGFTGQRLDTGPSLMFYQARYYDPAIGRFVSPDSIVPSVTNPQNFNRYSYVSNNPATLVDPTGHAGVDGYVSVQSLVIMVKTTIAPTAAPKPTTTTPRPPGEAGWTGAPKPTTTTTPPPGTDPTTPAIQPATPGDGATLTEPGIDWRQVAEDVSILAGTGELLAATAAGICAAGAALTAATVVGGVAGASCSGTALQFVVVLGYVGTAADFYVAVVDCRRAGSGSCQASTALAIVGFVAPISGQVGQVLAKEAAPLLKGIAGVFDGLISFGQANTR